MIVRPKWTLLYKKIGDLQNNCRFLYKYYMFLRSITNLSCIILFNTFSKFQQSRTFLQKIFLSVTRYNKRKTKHFYFIHVSILWRVTFRILNEIYFVIIEHQKKWWYWKIFFKYLDNSIYIKPVIKSHLPSIISYL